MEIKRSKLLEAASSVEKVSNGAFHYHSQKKCIAMAMFITSSGVIQETNLTERETEILQLVSQGLQIKEIAGMKYISIETVKQHLKNSYRKLGARNKIEALMMVGLI